MTRLAGTHYPAEMSAGGEPSSIFSIALSPQGHVHVDLPAGSDLPSSLVQIAKHFERGDGHGVFQLGARRARRRLCPVRLGFWRDVGRAFVVRLCATADLGNSAREDRGRGLAAGRVGCSGCRGAADDGRRVPDHQLSLPICAHGWPPPSVTSSTTWGRALSRHSYGRQALPWNLVGRVCFHLAENKNDPRCALRLPGDLHDTIVPRGRKPSTSSARLQGSARVRRRTQQGSAAGLARARAARRADERGRKGSRRWRRRVRDARLDARGGASVPDRGSATLKLPASSCGCRPHVRAKRPPRPEVQVTLGKAPWQGYARRRCDPGTSRSTSPSKGRPSRSASCVAILDGTDGLALVRGRWVEVDHERLRQVLDRWSTFEEVHAAGGLSVVEGLRLLAGAHVEEGAAGTAVGDVAEWSKVVAGESLAKALAGLRRSRNARRSCRSRSVAPR